MEITESTQHRLAIEDKSWLQRVFFIAFGGAGLLLLMSSINQYGIQAWYRLTHWMGALMAIGALLIYARSIFTLKFEVSLNYQQAKLSRLRGWNWEPLQTWPLAEITDLRIDRKVQGGRERFRLAVLANGNWLPIQRGFSNDFTQTEQAAKALQTYLQHTPSPTQTNQE